MYVRPGFEQTFSPEGNVCWQDFFSAEKQDPLLCSDLCPDYDSVFLFKRSMEAQKYDVCTRSKDQPNLIEQFSTKCYNTNAKLLWPITIGANRAVNQSEFEANTCNRRQARENAWIASHDWVWFCFSVLTRWEMGAHFSTQSQSEIKQSKIKE